MKTYKLTYNGQKYYLRDADPNNPIMDLTIGPRNYLYHEDGLQKDKEVLNYIEAGEKDELIIKFGLIKKHLAQHPIRETDVYTQTVTEINTEVLKENKFAFDASSKTYSKGQIKIQFESDGQGVHLADGNRTFYFMEDLMEYCRWKKILA